MLRRRGASRAKSGGLREFAAVRAAGRRGSVAAFCARLTPVNMFLLECFAFGSRLSICFYWGVLRLLHACQYVSIGAFYVRFTPVNMFLLECFAFDSRLSLFLCQEKRDGLREVAFLFRRGSGSPVVRSRVAVRLSDLVSSLRACAFSGGDPDGERKRRGNGVGGTV